MHNLPDNPTFDANVPVPDDGIDFRTAASLYGAFQALTDRTRWLHDLLKGTLLGEDVSFRRNVFVGLSLQVFGLAQLLNNLTVAGSTTVHALTANGEVTNNGLTHLNAATDAQDISCQSLFVNGVFCAIGTSLTDTCEVNASVNMRAPVRCYDSLATLALLNISGGAALQSTMNCLGSGRVVRPAIVGSQSGSTTVITPANASTYLFPTCTADQNFNLPALATNGDEVEVSTAQGSWYVNVRDPGGSTIRSLKYASGEIFYLKVKYVAGNWVQVNYSAVP